MTAAPVDRLLNDGSNHDAVVMAAMTDPRTYPQRVGRIDVTETHGSWVFLTDDRAYKVKKPVVLPFLDYGTLPRRRTMCRQEVKLNRRLAPEVYLGTVALTRRDGGFALAADDQAAERQVIEFAVEMRRFAEEDTLAARVRAGMATRDEIRGVAAVVARFHDGAVRRRLPGAARDALRRAIRTTLDDLAGAARDARDRRRVEALRRLLEAVLATRDAELRGRAARGLICDGHGDLRAEHVLLGPRLQIVDCLEFDPALRIADVAVDLAFLVMDLEALGAPGLARDLVHAYRSEGGDPGDDALLAAMVCFRALVRAKVATVRAGQRGCDSRSRREEATRLLALAERFAWRARRPLVLVCCGPAASGKSTLAARLAQHSGMPHVSSDLVRKDLAGVAPTARATPEAYTPELTAATYRALGLRVCAEVAEHGGAIVDATFHDAASRRDFADALGTIGAPILFVECRAPADVLERRADQRSRTPEHVSDATAQVVRHQLRAWDPLDEVGVDRHVVVRTDRPGDDILDDVLSWLDRRVADNR